MRGAGQRVGGVAAVTQLAVTAVCSLAAQHFDAEGGRRRWGRGLKGGDGCVSVGIASGWRVF